MLIYGERTQVRDVDLVWRLILAVVSTEIPGWSVVSCLESRLALSPGSVFAGASLVCPVPTL